MLNVAAHDLKAGFAGISRGGPTLTLLITRKHRLLATSLVILLSQPVFGAELGGKPIAIGLYVGNPNAGDPAAEAEFEQNYSRFAAILGLAPRLITVFIDHQKPISQWVDNASWQADSNRKSSAAGPLMPVISLPMASTAPGSPAPQQMFQNFAAGLYDDVLRDMVKAWADQGYHEQFWRPGWEMNLASAPWYAGSEAGMQTDWINAFRHIAVVLQEAAAQNGVTLQVIWNPNTANYSNAGVATHTLYPGDGYVDVIGADVYSDISPYGSPNAMYDWSKNDGSTLSDLKQWASSPVNLKHYWTYPAGTQWALDSSQSHSLSLQDLLDFAQTRGKPFAIPETGAGSTGDGAGMRDDPAFVEWLAATLAQTTAQVLFVNIWDSNGGADYKFSAPEDGKPSEAAAWGHYFGNAGSGQPSGQ